MLSAIADRTAAAGRAPSGVTGLDQLIGGGLPGDRSILLCGDIGTGKTTFGLQFLMAGVAHGDAGVFVCVDQKPRHLIEDARRFGWEIGGVSAAASLVVLDASPLFTALRGRSTPDARQITGDLTQQVRRSGAKRLVIDGVTSLAPDGGVEDFVRSLIASLEDNLGCTTLLTARTPGGSHESDAGPAMERLASGVIELRVGSLAGSVGRSMVIRKMRGGPTALAPLTFDLVDQRGLVLRDA
jgi:circadian clock protein KaiC